VAQGNHLKDGKKVLLSLRIAGMLESLILGGEFKGQAKLPSQEDLCIRFGVSSSVVREAIHLLKAKDILYTVNGVGSFVAERSVDPLKRLMLHYVSGAQEAHDYSELMELRLAIETTCAEKLADSGGAQDVTYVSKSHGIFVESTPEILRCRPRVSQRHRGLLRKLPHQGYPLVTAAHHAPVHGPHMYQPRRH